MLHRQFHLQFPMCLMDSGCAERSANASWISSCCHLRLIACSIVVQKLALWLDTMRLLNKHTDNYVYVQYKLTPNTAYKQRQQTLLIVHHILVNPQLSRRFQNVVYFKSLASFLACTLNKHLSNITSRKNVAISYFQNVNFYQYFTN